MACAVVVSKDNIKAVSGTFGSVLLRTADLSRPSDRPRARSEVDRLFW